MNFYGFIVTRRSARWSISSWDSNKELIFLENDVNYPEVSSLMACKCYPSSCNGRLESRIPDILLIDTAFLFFFFQLINRKFSDFFSFPYRMKFLSCSWKLYEEDFDGITKREKFRGKKMSTKKIFLYCTIIKDIIIRNNDIININPEEILFDIIFYNLLFLLFHIRSVFIT